MLSSLLPLFWSLVASVAGGDPLTATSDGWYRRSRADAADWEANHKFLSIEDKLKTPVECGATCRSVAACKAFSYDGEGDTEGGRCELGTGDLVIAESGDKYIFHQCTEAHYAVPKSSAVATASSEIDGNLVARLVLDGDAVEDPADFWHFWLSEKRFRPWLQVDLGERHLVTGGKITHAVSAAGNPRNVAVEVRVGDEEATGDDTLGMMLCQNHLCYRSGDDGMAGVKDFECSAPLWGSLVTVQKYSWAFDLNEVQLHLEIRELDIFAAACRDGQDRRCAAQEEDLDRCQLASNCDAHRALTDKSGWSAFPSSVYGSVTDYHGPGFAIDGLLTSASIGFFASDPFTDLAPWLQVQMEVARRVSGITLHDRKDWTSDRFHYFEARVGETDISDGSVSLGQRISANTVCDMSTAAIVSPLRMTCPLPLFGLYVTVQRYSSTGSKVDDYIMDVNEVDIHVPPDFADKSGWTALTSSQWLDFEASFAIDGQIVTSWHSFASTYAPGEDIFPWLQVTMDASRPVHLLAIHDRYDVQPNRFRDLEIRVGDADASDTPRGQKICVNRLCHTSGTDVASPKTFECSSVLTGRFITIQKLSRDADDHHLDINEVDVQLAPDPGDKAYWRAYSPQHLYDHEVKYAVDNDAVAYQFWHSGSGATMPWMQVTLGCSYLVNSVEVVHRPDRATNPVVNFRFTYLEVRVGDVDVEKSPVGGQQSALITYNKVCARFDSDDDSSPKNFACAGGPIRGKFVTVQKFDDPQEVNPRYLEIHEINIDFAG